MRIEGFKSRGVGRLLGGSRESREARDNRLRALRASEQEKEREKERERVRERVREREVDLVRRVCLLASFYRVPGGLMEGALRQPQVSESFVEILRLSIQG